MELETFKRDLIKYYGSHENKYVTEVTFGYVKSHYDSYNLENLIQSIMKSHPVKWGFPDVSAIEDSQETLFKRENKSYKKVILSKSNWSTDIKPLTEEDRIQAEKNRKKWIEMTKEAAEEMKRKH